MSDVSELIKRIDKITGLKALIGSDENLAVELIPFCIPQLDRCVGGGIPRGRITELKGDFGTGKSFLCQQLIRSAQYMGLSVVYFNVESKMDPRWLEKTGVDIDKIVVVQGNVGEKIIDSIVDLVSENVGLIIVDSLAAMITIYEAENSMEQATMGAQARMMSTGFRKILVPLSISKSALVFTNQVRSTMSPYSPESNPGGRAQDFYSSLTMNVRRDTWIETMKNNIKIRQGYNMEVRVTKNTIAPPWQVCTIPFYFSGEVDIIASLCKLALDCGLIHSAGSWFTFNEQKAQGWEGFVNIFRKDGDALRQLTEQIAEAE